MADRRYSLIARAQCYRFAVGRSQGRSLHRSSTRCVTDFNSRSASAALSARSANATSGSTIQNSARCREVFFEFSAEGRAEGIHLTHRQAVGLDCELPDTIKYASLPKKESERCRPGLCHLGRLVRSSVLTRNNSPAPSQSLAVIIGVLTQ